MVLYFGGIYMDTRLKAGYFKELIVGCQMKIWILVEMSWTFGFVWKSHATLKRIDMGEDINGYLLI